MRSVFQRERQALTFLASVQDGHAGGEGNFGRALVKNFSLQLDGALHRFVGDAEFQIGALHRVRDGRRVGFAHRFAREFQEMVVLVKRERDIARSRDGRKRGPVCFGEPGENQNPSQENC